MIKYEKFILENGLRVIVHQDKSTPIVAVNLLYKIGAKNENPNKTGFAHLFEHLMFEGSKNIPLYDEPLQNVGGTNNAFTNNDYTNYYITLPKKNIETAFWLESDRMLSLNFSDEKLEIQKNVVIEEYKQRYINQPYGDDMTEIRKLAYKIHPYQWETIGKDISHIENATLQDVKDFFFKYYAPNNAILAIAGDVTVEEIKKLSEKWFAPIKKRNIPEKNILQEPIQTSLRRKTIKRDVPHNAIYFAFPYSERLNPKFYASDLLSDVLANGDSARLYQKLIKEKEYFNEIDAYISGSIDKGLFLIIGQPTEKIDMKQAEMEILKELEILKTELISDYELQKVKNKIISAQIFSKTNVLNKAMMLAYYELLDDANLINTEIEKYNAVTKQDIKNIANEIFTENNSNIMYYLNMINS